MRAKKLVLVGLMAVLVLGLSACGGGGDDDGRVGGAEDSDLVVSDKIPFYDPPNLEIPLNQEVSFTVFNDGEEIHNITIPALFIDMDVQPGQQITVKLPATSQAPRDGFYTMYCKFHQSEGEAGRINITR